jgi:PAS domain S-box-containing protein
MRVLVVDDDELFAQMTADYLSQDDRLEVSAVESADEAIEYLDEEVADCIVSDFQMPGMDGLELLSRVRALEDDLPFILFTGRGSEEIASEAIHEGVTDYLQKRGPEQYDLLRNRIVHAVSHHRVKDFLDREREQFRQFVAAVSDYAIFMLDTSGHIVSWNEGAANIKGYTREEVLGNHISMFYTPEDVAAGIPEALLSTAAVYGVCEDEGWRVRKDDTRFWANVTITAVHDDEGTHTGFGKVTRDMTERREYEQRLKKQNERLEAVADIVSRELRDPLSVIRESLDRYRETGADELLDDVQEAAARIAELIAATLPLPREARRVGQGTDVPLGELAERAWQTVETGDARLVFAPDIGVVHAHAVRLTSVFENLFRHAVRHGLGADGPLTVTVGGLEDGFYVEDDGAGVPAESGRDRVITEGNGAAFGLGIARSIAEAHDWSVELREAASGGARIEVRGFEVG